GDGNDLIRNFEQSHPVGDIPGAKLSSITGGAGNDTLWLNDQDAQVDTPDYQIGDGQLVYDDLAGQQMTAIDPTIENFILDENNASTTTEINKIHSPLKVTVDGNGGNDAFTVGGGDIDSNGMDNLVVDGGTGTNSVEFDDHLDQSSPSEVETVLLNDGELVK